MHIYNIRKVRIELIKKSLIIEINEILTHHEAAFFNFLISLDAHVAKVFVLATFERLPLASKSLIVSLSTRGSML